MRAVFALPCVERGATLRQPQAKTKLVICEHDKPRGGQRFVDARLTVRRSVSCGVGVWVQPDHCWHLRGFRCRQLARRRDCRAAGPPADLDTVPAAVAALPSAARALCASAVPTASRRAAKHSTVPCRTSGELLARECGTRRAAKTKNEARSHYQVEE